MRLAAIGLGLCLGTAICGGNVQDGGSGIDKAKAVAAAHWGLEPEQLFAEDLTPYSSWCQRHTLVLVVDPERRRLPVTIAADGSTESWEPGQDLSSRIPRVSAFLQAEGWPLPAGRTPLELAQAARLLLAGFGGQVASVAFCRDQPPDWVGWSRGDDRKTAAFFEPFCRDPELGVTRGGWSLEFHFFNDRGGIEHWRIEGNANEILSAERTEAVPDGTLSYPYG